MIGIACLNSFYTLQTPLKWLLGLANYMTMNIIKLQVNGTRPVMCSFNKYVCLFNMFVLMFVCFNMFALFVCFNLFVLICLSVLTCLLCCFKVFVSNMFVGLF